MFSLYMDDEEFIYCDSEEEEISDDTNIYIHLSGRGNVIQRKNDLTKAKYECYNHKIPVKSRQADCIKGCEGSVKGRKYFIKQADVQIDNIDRDKKFRATIQKVLDPRTYDFLLKTEVERDLVEINGCISTGKEANVYHAIDRNHNEFALKIYKTACMAYKKREGYIAGNHNTRYGCSKSKNSRKMVKTWSEKEYRNLELLKSRAVGIYSPEAFLLKGNILTMEFIGKDGIPAPKLKDADLSFEKASQIYWDLVSVVRQMYTQCKLVHADLSEYNILYYEQKPYIIDVSQSVSPEHPSAYEFLKRDITNITNFFKKNQVMTMLPSVFFDFVVNTVKNEDIHQYIRRIENETENTDRSVSDSDISAQEDLFKQLCVPTLLNEVNTFENEFIIFKNDKVDANDLAYQKLLDVFVTNFPIKEKEPKNCLVQAADDDSSDFSVIVEDEEECEEEQSTDNDLRETEEDKIKMTVEECALKERRRPSGRPKNETREEKLKRLSDVREKKREKRKAKKSKNIKKGMQKRRRKGR